MLRQNDPNLIDELRFYDRVQVNINARRTTFSAQEVIEIYRTLKNEGIPFIAQYHEDSSALTDEYLKENNGIQLLFDDSKGRGQSPDSWPKLKTAQGTPLFCGYAGGINPSNIAEQLPLIEEAAAGHPYWIDMETGVRTHNQFDLEKATSVLYQSA